jgi:hypothetical protein
MWISQINGIESHFIGQWGSVNGEYYKIKKVHCRNSRPLTIACHMKKVVRSLLCEALVFLTFFSISALPAPLFDDVKIERGALFS